MEKYKIRQKNILKNKITKTTLIELGMKNVNEIKITGFKVFKIFFS